MKTLSRFTGLIMIAILVFVLPLTSTAESSVTDRLRASGFVFAGTDCSDKKEAMIRTADRLLNAGYEPAFVAGLLGNIAREADFGRFENIFGYSEARIRTVFANKIAAGGHIYVAHMQGLSSLDGCGHSHEEYRPYNNKHIYDGFSLNTISSILAVYQAEGWKALFGLGTIQWSMTRTITLMDFYHQAAGASDTITYDQTVEAELSMMVFELQGSYQYIYTNWKAANAGNLASEAAARDAGDRICRYYEGLTGESSRNGRSLIAGAIYQVMSTDIPGLPTLTPTPTPTVMPDTPSAPPVFTPAQTQTPATPVPVNTAAPVATVTPIPEEFRLDVTEVSLTLQKDRTYRLTWTGVNGLQGMLSYLSTEPSVAAVSSDGLIQAKAVGTAVIIAQAPGGTACACVVTVTGPKVSFATLQSLSKRTVTVKPKCKEKIVSWELRYRKAGSTKWEKKTYRTAASRLTGLKSRQTYEFMLRIRFRANDGKKYVTAWSAVKKVKVK